MKALDATSAFSALGLLALLLVEMNHSIFRGLMSPTRFPI